MIDHGKPYTSTRLSAWRVRQSTLDEHFVETLEKLEEYGWQRWTISDPDEHTQRNFAYTVGLYDFFQVPELIVVGLPSEVGAGALRAAAEALREGKDLSKGRHLDMLVGEGIEVVFRPVEPSWLHHVMLRTDWYYEGENIPALQLIYPDLSNRFQWEQEFDDRFRQPLLDKEHLCGQAERTFWNQNTPGLMKKNWPFADDRHTSAFLSTTVHEGTEPVVFVSHDYDGDWQFLGDSMRDGGGPVLVCLHHPIDADPSIRELHDLPVGWYAERDTSDAPWRRHELPPPDENE